MKLQFAFLCDSANISQNNLFNALGGGIENIFLSQLPFTRPLTLLLRVEYDLVMESGEHDVNIRVLNANGADKITPLSLRITFPEKERFFNFVAALVPTFDEYGAHSVEIAVDRYGVASIPLNAVAQKG
ncbi:MAG: hypothetical protein PHV55_01040 [Candidatus Omnitrophica bacterium]|nr:hypothetical protein [Candidatus Omnitrophota bacterium]